MKYAYYDSLIFQKTETDSRVRISIVDSTSATEKTLWEKVLPLYLLIFVFILAMPFLVLFMIWIMLKSLFVKKAPPQPTYEEAKQWFEDEKGYFDNLSEPEKQQIVSKKKLPLGL
jgi:hypothetical protein